jgi:hypothetical protein
VWLPWVRVRAELGQKVELHRADMWQNSTRPQPFTGGGGGLKEVVRIVAGFTSFKLVVPPLQLGAVGPYLVRGPQFPSRLPLEGTWSYPDLLGHNRRPAVLGNME